MYQAYNTVSRPAYRLSVALLLMIAYHQPVQFRQLASSHTHMLLAHLTCTKEATLQPATFYTLVTATQSAAQTDRQAGPVADQLYFDSSTKLEQTRWLSLADAGYIDTGLR